MHDDDVIISLHNIRENLNVELFYNKTILYTYILPPRRSHPHTDQSARVLAKAVHILEGTI